MACGQCSSGGCGSVKTLATIGDDNTKTAGCSSGGCSSGGCTKLNTFDWLSDMELPTTMRYNVIEVKFKGGRKEYFRNAKRTTFHTGDFVVCDMPSGFHIGTVSLQGELVRLQMIKKGVADNKDLPKILRMANEKDMEKHQQAINRDLPTMYRVRELISQHKLKMKLSDVEFQSDNSKATFYYSAEDRVDFRELIKTLASEFRVRIDMRQISMRQEAARIGGIGSCGRELCCSTWLTSFKSISTSAARYQNLSLNPAKLSGQCGRLKCCLNYELETYVDALQDIPKVKKPLFTEKGEAYLQKTDIFRKLMWFGYKNDADWKAIPCSQVVEIMEMNTAGKKPMSLENLSLMADFISKKEPINTELEKLDRKLSQGKPGSKSNKKKRFNKNRNNRPKSQNQGEKKAPNNQQGNRGQRPNQKAKAGQNPNRKKTNTPQKKQGPVNTEKAPANQARPKSNNRNRNNKNRRNNNRPNKTSNEKS